MAWKSRVAPSPTAAHWWTTGAKRSACNLVSSGGVWKATDNGKCGKCLERVKAAEGMTNKLLAEEIPFGNAYDECARCGSWRYTHATSDLSKNCPGFKEEGRPRKVKRMDNPLASLSATERKRRYERLLDFTQDMAEHDCEYGDNCPDVGSRHGRCVGCHARKALSDAGAAPRDFGVP